MFITLLGRDIKNTDELERFFNWCRIEYVEQYFKDEANFLSLSCEDAKQIYCVLAVKEQLTNRED